MVLETYLRELMEIHHDTIYRCESEKEFCRKYYIRESFINFSINQIIFKFFKNKKVILKSKKIISQVKKLLRKGIFDTQNED